MTIAGRYWRVTRLIMTRQLRRELDRRELICHTCDNPPCCNPRHLYVGTSATNAADREARGRGIGAPAKWRSLTHCKNNHEFTPENTYVRTDRKGRTARTCRKCNAASQRRVTERMGTDVLPHDGIESPAQRP